jgi:hypothetical protein
MLRVTRLRSSLDSPPAIFTIIAIVTALVSLAAVSIPKVNASPSFGFESPVCWLTVLLLLGAILLPNLTFSLACVMAAELVLIAWYGWAMWLVTTPRFSSQYAFVGTDIVGPAWYAAAIGLLCAAAVVARRYRDYDDPPGLETWWLAAPGFGLLRLDRTARGLTWAVLVAAALFVASLDSPFAPLFQPLNGFENLPDPVPTRAPTWILLGIALLFGALSILDTIRARRRRLQR